MGVLATGNEPSETWEVQFIHRNNASVALMKLLASLATIVASSVYTCKFINSKIHRGRLAIEWPAKCSTSLQVLATGERQSFVPRRAHFVHRNPPKAGLLAARPARSGSGQWSHGEFRALGEFFSTYFRKIQRLVVTFQVNTFCKPFIELIQASFIDLQHLQFTSIGNLAHFALKGTSRRILPGELAHVLCAGCWYAPEPELPQTDRVLRPTRCAASFGVLPICSCILPKWAD